MKLLELAAKEIQTWPSGCDYVTQSPTTGVFVFNNDGSSDFEAVDIAQDAKTAAVTRSQWKAERARIIFDSLSKRDPLIEEITSGASFGDTMQCDFESEGAKKYEQELWDKAYFEAWGSGVKDFISHNNTVKKHLDSLPHISATLADAFMAERAKRMKQ